MLWRLPEWTLVPRLRHVIVSILLLAQLAAVAFLLFAWFATIALLQLSAIRIAVVSFLLLPRLSNFEQFGPWNRARS